MAPMSSSEAQGRVALHNQQCSLLLLVSHLLLFKVRRLNLTTVGEEREKAVPQIAA